jgi:hypothetical protein
MNGSTWTTGGLNSNKQDLGGAGTQTAALAFGGYNPGLSPAYYRCN